MLFLIDENCSASIGLLFKERGFEVECVKDIKKLRGQSDEVVFNYAANNQSIVVTKDLGFANPLRFDLTYLPGIVIIRFPNEVSTKAISKEIKRLINGMIKEDFLKRIIVIEPGNVRSRGLL